MRFEWNKSSFKNAGVGICYYMDDSGGFVILDILIGDITLYWHWYTTERYCPHCRVYHSKKFIFCQEKKIEAK